MGSDSPRAALTAGPPPLAERSRYTMGTTAGVRIEALRAGSSLDVSVLAEAALDRIDEVDRAASLYRPESALNRVNREGFPGPVPAGPLLGDLIGVSLRMARSTRGLFDPTIKPLMDHLGFYREIGSAPIPGGIREARSRVGWRKVRWDPSSGCVRFRRNGMALDFGGIGKGYALDLATALLRRSGVTVAQLELGGSSWAFLGSDPGTPDGLFRLAVDDPGKDGYGSVAAVAVPEGSVATSVPLQQTRDVSGRKVGHIVDPRKGPLATRVRSATVWARTGVEAEALTKALVVGGPGMLPRLARRFRFEALILLEDGPAVATPGLKWEISGRSL